MKRRKRGHYDIPLKECEFCGGIFKFLGLHLKYCHHKDNTKYSEDYIRKRGKITSRTNRTRVWSKVSRQRLSVAMQQVVRENPESYSGSNRWKNRPTVYKGERFVSSWEVKVAKTLDSIGVGWRKNAVCFPYSWNGNRQYFPDFYVKRYRVYVEVKGRRTERDLFKWRQFEGRLLVITQRGVRELDSDRSLLRMWLKQTRQDDGEHYLIR